VKGDKKYNLHYHILFIMCLLCL